MSPRRTALTAAAVYLLAILCVFGDTVLSRTRVLSKDGEDLATIFLYWEQFDSGALRAGTVPLWNPHVYAGAPYFGGFQPALAYPPTWFGALLPTVVAINLGIVLHFFAAGMWTYLWAARRRLHPAACILAGLVFMLCGTHVLQVYRGHLPNLRTLVWAPLILLAVDGLLETGALGWTLLGMAAVALQILAGHIQETFYTALLVGLYTAACGLRAPRRVRFAAGVAAMYAGGAALAAVQLLAGIDAVAESVRGRLSYTIASSFSFPPENLLTLFAPGVFGDMIREPYWGRWTLSEASLFVGCAATVLALYGAIRGTPAQRRFSLALAVTALVLAFGDSTPLYRVLYEHAPWYGSFRGTTKFTFLAALFVAMLAGVGFDRLLRQDPPERWPALAALAAAALLAAAGGAILFSAQAGADGGWARALGSLDLRNDAYRYFAVDRGSDFTWRAGRHAAAASFVAAATFAAVGSVWLGARRRHALVYGIAVIACVELIAYARYTLPSFDAGERLRAVERVAKFHQTMGGDSRTMSNMPYVAMAAGSFEVWGDDPMILARYAEFIAFTQGRNPDDAEILTVRRATPLMRLLRLRHLLRIEPARIEATGTGLDEMPRAQLVPHWRVVTDRDQRLAAMREAAFDPRDTVLLESAPDPAPADGPTDGTVSLVDLSTDRIEIRAEAPHPAILVLGENYSAGWQATALPDSAQRTYTVLPADHILRAIPLQAGTHHLLLEYRPRGYVLGRWISMAALVGYALAVAWSRRRA